MGPVASCSGQEGLNWKQELVDKAVAEMQLEVEGVSIINADTDIFSDLTDVSNHGTQGRDRSSERIDMN